MISISQAELIMNLITELIYQGDKLMFNAGMDINDIRRENLRALIRQVGKASTVGAKIDMSSSQMSQIAGPRFTRNIGTDIARRIETAFGKPHGWMDTTHPGVEGEQPTSASTENQPGREGMIELSVTPAEKKLIDDFVLIPKYDVKASMGNGTHVVSEEVVDMLAFKRNWVQIELGINPINLVLITAVGDSMEPTLRPGDLILIDRSVQHVVTDSVYVLALDGELLAKRIQRLFDGSLEIISDNPAYKTQVLNPEQVERLRVVGRVVWAGRRM